MESLCCFITLLLKCSILHTGLNMKNIVQKTFFCFNKVWKWYQKCYKNRTKKQYQKWYKNWQKSLLEITVQWNNTFHVRKNALKLLPAFAEQTGAWIFQAWLDAKKLRLSVSRLHQHNGVRRILEWIQFLHGSRGFESYWHSTGTYLPSANWQKSHSKMDQMHKHRVVQKHRTL